MSRPALNPGQPTLRTQDKEGRIRKQIGFAYLLKKKQQKDKRTLIKMATYRGVEGRAQPTEKVPCFIVLTLEPQKCFQKLKNHHWAKEKNQIHLQKIRKELNEPAYITVWL